MSDSEKNTDIEAMVTSLIDETPHPVAELEEIEEFEEFDSTFAPTPSLKDFLQSPDSPSRYLMVLSILFATLATLCFGMLVYQYIKHRHSEQKPAVVSEVVKLEPTIEEKMGEFRVMWSDGELRADLVVQCATTTTCEELKNRKSEARDRILPILQSSSRTEILNPTKKQLLRQEITDSLNEMKLPGKILESNFSDLTVEISH